MSDDDLNLVRDSLGGTAVLLSTLKTSVTLEEGGFELSVPGGK
ncbi:MAG TPA: hypothetical protein VNX23_09105 [Bradyrhizobium sp.]|jgi:hypothetical protein|nr:hypothetical protein [Bradyrhizobium sp.]HXB77542.1 hypothetical protein [Bradyrhizobium sp.]